MVDIPYMLDAYLIYVVCQLFVGLRVALSYILQIIKVICNNKTLTIYNNIVYITQVLGILYPGMPLKRLYIIHSEFVK